MLVVLSAAENPPTAPRCGARICHMDHSCLPQARRAVPYTSVWHAHLAALPAGHMQAPECLAANQALPQLWAVASKTLLSSIRATKPLKAVDSGSFLLACQQGCVGGKLPISRDCVSRKGSYWNLSCFLHSKFVLIVLSLAEQGRGTSWLSDFFARVCLGQLHRFHDNIGEAFLASPVKNF